MPWHSTTQQKFQSLCNSSCPSDGLHPLAHSSAAEMLLSRHPFHGKFYFLPVTGKCEGNQRPQAPGWNFPELFLLGTSTEEWKFPLGGVLCSMQQAITSPQGLQKWHKARFRRCELKHTERITQNTSFCCKTRCWGGVSHPKSW